MIMFKFVILKHKRTLQWKVVYNTNNLTRYHLECISTLDLILKYHFIEIVFVFINLSAQSYFFSNLTLTLYLLRFNKFLRRFKISIQRFSTIWNLCLISDSEYAFSFSFCFHTSSSSSFLISPKFLTHISCLTSPSSCFHTFPSSCFLTSSSSCFRTSSSS